LPSYFSAFHLAALRSQLSAASTLVCSTGPWLSSRWPCAFNHRLGKSLHTKADNDCPSLQGFCDPPNPDPFALQSETTLARTPIGSFGFRHRFCVSLVQTQEQLGSLMRSSANRPCIASVFRVYLTTDNAHTDSFCAHLSLDATCSPHRLLLRINSACNSSGPRLSCTWRSSAHASRVSDHSSHAISQTFWARPGSVQTLFSPRANCCHMAGRRKRSRRVGLMSAGGIRMT